MKTVARARWRGFAGKRFPGRINAAQTGTILIVWLSMWLLSGNAPLAEHWTPAVILLLIVFCLLARNLYLTALALACTNLAYRWNIQVSHWHDMAWGQLYSISSLIAGHDIYVPSGEVGMSLANYLPMGNLYGGLLIGLGIHRYWDVWHFLVIALLLLPFLLRPGVATLVLFVFTATFYPFSDYTSGGGNLEISYAITLAAIALYRADLLDLSLVFFAFAAMMRQPSAMLVPFVGLLLWQARDYRRLKLFALLLFLFGGIYILLVPRHAYQALYGVWAPYAQQWYNAYGGLRGNYSLSTVLVLLGVKEQTAWVAWQAMYMPVTLAFIGVLFGFAWRSGKRDTVLALGVFGTVFVYLVSRGYAQYHYILGTAMPLAAFLVPRARRPLPTGRWLAAGLAFVFVWMGAVPLAILGLGKAASLYTGLRPSDPEIPVASTAAVSPFAREPIANLNGDPAHQHVFRLSETAEFELAHPALVSEVEISGEKVPVQNVRGVPMLYATEDEMRGALLEGDIQGSADGRAFFEMLHFHTPESYSVYPLRLRVPPTPAPVRFIRVHPRGTFDRHASWIVGRIAIRGQ